MCLESRADPPTDCTAGTLSADIARFTYGYDDFKAVRAPWELPTVPPPRQSDQAELLSTARSVPCNSSIALSFLTQVMILIWRNLALSGSLWCGPCPASARRH